MYSITLALWWNENNFNVAHCKCTQSHCTCTAVHMQCARVHCKFTAVHVQCALIQCLGRKHIIWVFRGNASKRFLSPALPFLILPCTCDVTARSGVLVILALFLVLNSFILRFVAFVWLSLNFVGCLLILLPLVDEPLNWDDPPYVSARVALPFFNMAPSRSLMLSWGYGWTFNLVVCLRSCRS